MPSRFHLELSRSIIGMFILNYDHGSAAAVNQKLRSLNFHSTRDVDPATYIGLILCAYNNENSL